MFLELEITPYRIIRRIVLYTVKRLNICFWIYPFVCSLVDAVQELCHSVIDVQSPDYDNIILSEAQLSI